jgi:hypothetical protein
MHPAVSNYIVIYHNPIIVDLMMSVKLFASEHIYTRIKKKYTRKENSVPLRTKKAR